MKHKNRLTLILFYFSLLLLNYVCLSKDKKPEELYDINDVPLKHNLNNNKKIIDNFSKRNLEGEIEYIDEYYEHLKIKIELDNFKYKIPERIKNYQDVFINAMDKAKTSLESFLKIYYNGQSLTINDEKLTKWGIEKWDINLYGGSTGKPFDFENYNFGIFFKFASLHEENMASSKIVFVDALSTPIIGVITLNQDIPIDKLTPNYLEALMLHEFTHLLGFHKKIKTSFDDDPEEFFNGIIIEETSKYYVRTEKVINYAKKYFGCTESGENEITEIELEIDENDNVHWPARLLLGEYMTKFNYMEEQVISGFTLAFFEDLGYLKVKNYYTGGLMRFGKHKGCEFLKKKCVNDEETFKNEFYYPENIEDLNINEESCSSGRLSKTIYKLKLYDSDLPENYRYFSNPKIGGISLANYCPISLYSSETPLFSGRCSSKGTISDTTLSQKIGESLSEQSFCALSSLIKKTFSDYGTLSNKVRAVCFEMYCSDQSLTIKIGNDYLVCPREGGRIENDNFGGYLLCPDYNLICTGSYLCNDMFDCLTKKSIEKENTYIYGDNYQIKTTQVSSEYKVMTISKGWELSQNGACPQYCSHCDQNKHCIKCAQNYRVQNNICVNKVEHCSQYDENEICIDCEENYAFIEGDHSICKLINDLEQKYIPESSGSKNYVKCSTKIPNCNKCNSETYCISCLENYGIIDSSHLQCKDLTTNKYYFDEDEGIYKECSNKLDNCDLCKQINNNYINCLQCKTNYALVHEETDNCKLLSSLQNDYLFFTDDNKLNYYLCSDNKYHLVENCLTCQKKDTCDSCKNGYLLYNSNKLCLSQKDIEGKYFKNSTDNNYYLCSKAIRGCEKCNNGDECIECNTAFDLDENNKCISTSLTTYKYYLNPSTGKYESCTKIENCDECKSSTECTRCQNGYELNNNLCQKIENDSNDNTKAIAIAGIVLSCMAIVVSIVTIIIIIFRRLLFRGNVEKIGDTVEIQNVNNEGANEIVVQPSRRRSIHNEVKGDNV